VIPGDYGRGTASAAGPPGRAALSWPAPAWACAGGVGVGPGRAAAVCRAQPLTDARASAATTTGHAPETRFMFAPLVE
jgi:hypothetical protein